MKYLPSHLDFELLLGRGDLAETQTPYEGFTIVYFTATWCGACKHLDTDALEEATTGIQWLKCDIDQNKYTAGYCGIKSIPSFIAIHNKKVLGTFQSSDTTKVYKWIQTFYNGK
jgi:thioredoxin-like negative regulator of GroEL